VKKRGWCEFKKINVEYNMFVIWPGEPGNKTRKPIKQIGNCNNYDASCNGYRCLLDPDASLGASNPFPGQSL